MDLNCLVIDGVDRAGMTIFFIRCEVTNVVEGDCGSLIVRLISEDWGRIALFVFLNDPLEIDGELLVDISPVLSNEVKGLNPVLVGRVEEFVMNGDEDNLGEVIAVADQLAQLQAGSFVTVDVNIKDKDVVSTGFWHHR